MRLESCLVRRKQFQREGLEWCSEEGWKSELSVNLREEDGRTQEQKIQMCFEWSLWKPVSIKKFYKCVHCFFFFKDFLFWGGLFLSLFWICYSTVSVFCYYYFFFAHKPCGVLSHQLGMEPVQSSNHWAGREVLRRALRFIRHYI